MLYCYCPTNYLAEGCNWPPKVINFCRGDYSFFFKDAKSLNGSVNTAKLRQQPNINKAFSSWREEKSVICILTSIHCFTGSVVEHILISIGRDHQHPFSTEATKLQ